MKSTFKIFFIAILFCSTVFGGDLPNGNRTCPNGQTTCLVAENGTDIEDNQPITDDSILIVIQEYLGAIIEIFDYQD